MTQNDPNQPQKWLKWIDWLSKIDLKSYNEFVLIEFRSIFVIFFILLQSLPLTGCPFSFIFIMNGNNYEPTTYCE